MSDLKKERKPDTKQKKEVWKPNENINEDDEHKKMERVIEQAKKAGKNDYDEREKMRRVLDRAKKRSRDSQSDTDMGKKIIGAMDEKYRPKFIEKPKTEQKEHNENEMVFASNNKVENSERKSDISDKKIDKPELKKPTDKKGTIKENREKEKEKEPEREKREIPKEKQKTREINREQEEQQKINEKESNESEKIKEKKSKNIDTKKKRDVSNEKNKICEPKLEKEKEIDKKKLTKELLEKHKETKDKTKDINDLEKLRNDNNNLIDHCKKKFQEGFFNGIITREVYEKKLQELIKKNEQIEKQLTKFSDCTAHLKKLDCEKLKEKREEILEKKNTELIQKQENEKLKKESQKLKEMAKELGKTIHNREHEKESSSEVKEKEKTSDDNNKDKEMVRDNNVKREYDRIVAKNHLVDNPKEYIKENPQLNEINGEKKELLEETKTQEIIKEEKETVQVEVETKERRPYGYIYLLTNNENGKVWVGQTTRERWEENQVPIQERWREHIKEAENFKKKKETVPDQKIQCTYLNNAINKYGPTSFRLEQIDTVKNQRELDKKEVFYIKKFNSTSPSKGYNMTEGGRGGRLSPEVCEKISKTMEEKWKDQQYREDQCKKISEGMTEMWKDPKLRDDRIKSLNTPEVKKILSEITKKRWKVSQYLEQVSEAISKGSKKMWQNPEIQKKQREGLKEKWKDPNYRKNFAKDISNIEEFLDDIEHLKQKELTEKFKMTHKTINRNIKVIFGPDGPSNFWEAKRYLQNKDPEYREEKKYIYMKEVNIAEFLLDIRDTPTRKEMVQKYGMSGPSIIYRIKKIFKSSGPKNFTEAKKYLQGKSKGDILEMSEEWEDIK